MRLPSTVLDRVRGMREAAALVAIGALGIGGCGGATRAASTSSVNASTSSSVVVAVSTPTEPATTNAQTQSMPEEEYPVDCGRG